jgi:signal transduction histidine kinase
MIIPPPVHVLLVDDLDANLLALEALLKRDGLVILKARGGVEALELLLSHEVALALVDVQMPEMDGFELAEIMRGAERTKRVPIIFVTAGVADRQRRFRGYEAGAVDFLSKPIEPDILRSKANVFFELERQRQQIGAQNEELKTLAAALQEADRRKDEFLAILAHELRNPLTPLANGLSALAGPLAEEKGAQVRAMMERQLNHLVRLIDDLMDVSRISRGKIDLRRCDVDMSDVAHQAIELSQPMIDAGRHRFRFNHNDGALIVDADATRLAQVLSNLINNAAKYTPAGGEISLTLRREGEMAVAEVADNGVGLAPDMLAHVFGMFMQVDPLAENARSGLGIGLALARRLVEMHGGELIAASEGVGRGATFTVRLPMSAAAGAAEALSAPAASRAEALRVLVVDDNADVAETVGWLLDAIGHDFTIVHDGRVVLETAARLQPDVILLDLGLPVMDGYAVCRALRADPRFQKTQIIAQTGWGQDSDREKTAQAGFDSHLVKPVSLDRLETALAEAAARLGR